MEYAVRFLVESDYDKLCRWWQFWRFPAPPRDFLPQDGLSGLMVTYKNTDIVAGFIYFTNSKICWSEFIVSNHEFRDKEKRKEAIKILIHEINTLAKSKGCKYIYTVVKNQNLKKTYQEMGFMDGSVKVDEMVMML